MANRIIIITNSYSSFAPKLIASFLSVLREDRDAAAVAVVDVGSWEMSRTARRYATWSAIRFFNPHVSPALPGRPGTIRKICRRFGVPLIHFPGIGINHPEFQRRVQDEMQANLMISIDCTLVLSPQQLSMFDVTVNYHNGLLPAYRGLRSTEWALYRGDSRVGFTFHHMSENLDGGNILVSDSIPVDKMTRAHEVEDKKTACAAGYCARVVEKMKMRDPGIPQSGDVGYYSRKKFMNIRNIGNPSTMTWSELEKRISYFGPVALKLNDKKFPVSSVVMDEGDSPFHFTTLDGVCAKATRFFYLPFPVYSMASRMGLIP